MGIARGKGALFEVIEEADAILALKAAHPEVEAGEGGDDGEVVADLRARGEVGEGSSRGGDGGCEWDCRPRRSMPGLQYRC